RLLLSNQESPCFSWGRMSTDKSQTPHLRNADLCKKFGVAESTVQAKSKIIRDMLGMRTTRNSL
ncbi:MAG: DUF6398 domain-containing protein, partial [Methylobacter sp.]